MEFFNDFFGEVVRQKQRAVIFMQRPDISAPATGVDAARALVESIAHSLQEILEKQHAHVIHRGGEYALTLYRDVQYVMVALADEIFLSLPWSGKSLWEEKILEERVFHTHIAGERIFERIEDLLALHNADKDDLAKAYLFALSLGFKGKYMDDIASIETLKRRLFLLINHYHPRLTEPEYHLFTSAYSELLENDVIRMLPNARIWHAILYASLLTLMFISYIFWYGATHELESVAKQIVSISGVDKQ